MTANMGSVLSQRRLGVTEGSSRSARRSSKGPVLGPGAGINVRRDGACGARLDMSRRNWTPVRLVNMRIAIVGRSLCQTSAERSYQHSEESSAADEESTI